MELKDINYFFILHSSSGSCLEIKKEKTFLPRKFIRITFNNNFSLSTKYTYNKKVLLEFYDKLKSQMLESRKQLNDLEM